MKRNICILLGTLCLLLASAAVANGQFERAMVSSIPAMFKADSPEKMTAAINKLNRIGEAEKNRWEPYYYAAFGYLRMTGMVESAADKDMYLNLGLEMVKKAEAIKPNDSELETMRGYLIMMQLNVDPGTRGMTHSGMAFGSFQKALALDGNNPRAHFLLGRMQHGTAQFMGTGSEEACQSLSRAKALFDAPQKSDNPFAPSWGKEATEGSIQEICN